MSGTGTLQIAQSVGTAIRAIPWRCNDAAEMYRSDRQSFQTIRKILSQQSYRTVQIGRTKLDWQNITDGRSFNTPDIDPLFRHWNQRMNPALDGFQSLRQGRGLPIRRHHEKRAQPL